MKQNYIKLITDALTRVDDINLLDLIYKLIGGLQQ